MKEPKQALELGLEGAQLIRSSSEGYVHLELSRAYRGKGDCDSALKEIGRARERGLDNDDVHFELGMLYQEKGEYDLAIEELKTALTFNPLNGHIHFELGCLHQKKGDLDLAINEIKKAQELDFENDMVHLFLGLLYRRRKEYVQSVKELEEALRISPRKDEPFFFNKILNEIEISQRKTELKSKPRKLGITLTNRCNLRCMMCEIWKEKWDIPENIVKEVIGLFPYLEHIVWQGGEVFLVDCFEGLFDEAIKYPNLMQTIITNGLLVDEKWARKLARRNVSLTIGIDGITQETYEYIRRGAKFDGLLKSLETLHKFKLEYNRGVKSADRMITIMNFVVMSFNYRELHQIIEFAKRFEFDALQLYSIEGVVDPNNIFLHKDQRALEYLKKVMPEVSKMAKEYGICLDVSLPGIEGEGETKDAAADKRQGYDLLMSNCPDFKKVEMTCYLPWQQIFMTPEHKLRAGCYCRKEIGDINFDSLEGVWNGEVMQLYRKKILDNDARDLCYRVPKELDAHFEMIKIHYSQKEYPLVLEGLDKFKEFIEFNPDHFGAHLLLGRIYSVIQKEYLLASKEYKKAIEISPQNPEAHYELGLIYRSMNERASSINEIKRAQELGFNKGEAHFELGCIYRDEGNYVEAVEEIKIALRDALFFERGHLELARIYKDMGDYDSASKEIKQVQAIHPDDEGSYIELSRIYRKQGKYEQAKEELRTGLSQNSCSCQIRLELSRVYQENKDYDSALNEIRHIVESGFDNEEVRLESSKIYREKGAYDQAIEELRATLKYDNGQYGVLRLELARLYQKTKDYESAIMELKKAIEVDRRNFGIHLELARIYRAKRAFDLAIEEFSRAAELDPLNFEARLELAGAYHENGEYLKAIKELDAILRKNSSNSRVYLELGRAYRKKKDYDQAVKALNRAIELGLDNEEIHVEIGRIYKEKGMQLKAIEELKIALNYNSTVGYIHLELGWIYNEIADYELAIKELEHAISLGVETKEVYLVHLLLGDIYRKVGKYDFSVREFKRVLEIGPDRDAPFFHNRIHNEIEISQKRVVLESKPRSLGITLTNKCNLRCRICGVWKEDWEIPLKIIQEVIDFFPYLERIVWQGGEVFLSEYFEGLFEKASAFPNLKQTIITNGLLIDERWAQRLSRDNVTLIYSIDSVVKDIYEDIVGGMAKFEDLLRSIDLINIWRQKNKGQRDPSKKTTTIINVVLMRSNYRQLERFVDFAKEQQFDEIQLVPMLNIPGSEDIFSNGTQDVKEYITRVIPEVSKKARDYGIVFHNWTPAFIASEGAMIKETFEKDANENYNEPFCFLPWQQMFMTPDRKLKPGCYCSKEIGDIARSSLKEIWNGEIMQLYRRRLLENGQRDLCSHMCLSGAVSRSELKVNRYL